MFVWFWFEMGFVECAGVWFGWLLAGTLSALSFWACGGGVWFSWFGCLRKFKQILKFWL